MCETRGNHRGNDRRAVERRHMVAHGQKTHSLRTVQSAEQTQHVVVVNLISNMHQILHRPSYSGYVDHSER
mgnify:CR=1 FL=1